jgi:hypothetical protein
MGAGKCQWFGGRDCRAAAHRAAKSLCRAVSGHAAPGAPSRRSGQGGRGACRGRVIRPRLLETEAGRVGPDEPNRRAGQCRQSPVVRRFATATVVMVTSMKPDPVHLWSPPTFPVQPLRRAPDGCRWTPCACGPGSGPAAPGDGFRRVARTWKPSRLRPSGLPKTLPT